jgi:outer membrane protein TolC
MCVYTLLVVFLVSCGIASSDPANAASSSSAALPDGPLTVQDCVGMALDRNFSIVNAREGVRESQGAQLAAISGLAPHITSGGSFSRRIQGPQEFYVAEWDLTFETDRLSSDTYSYNIQATQNLLSVRDWANVSSAGHSVRSSRYLLQLARQTVAYQVKAQFYELLKATKLAEVSQAAMELSLDELRRANALFEVGSVAKGDVLKAKVRVSQSELELIAAENRVKLERSRLAKMMGLSVDAPVDIVEDMGAETPGVEVDNPIPVALKRRPDVLAARENLKGAKASRFASKAARLPSVYSSLQYSWSDNSFPETWDAHRKNYSWNVRLGLSLPIFDGLSIAASVKQATARAAMMDNEMRETELQAALEVKEALLVLDEATKRIAAAKSGLASAEEDYRLSRERYDVGSGTMLELLDAEVSLSRARSSYVEALASLRMAEALLEKATGQPVE